MFVCSSGGHLTQLHRLKQLYGGSLIWITHDVSEAAKYADTILVFVAKERGRVVAIRNDHDDPTGTHGLRDRIINYMR